MLLDMQGEFGAAVDAIGSSPREQTEDETPQVLAIVKQKVLTTMAERKTGFLPDISDRLELIKPEELDLLNRRFHLEEEPLIKTDFVHTYKSPIFEAVGGREINVVGARKFKLQPEDGNPHLVMVCIEIRERKDFAVGLVTQQELDLLAQDLKFDEDRYAGFIDETPPATN